MAIDKNAVINEARKFAAKGQFDKAIAEWKKVAKDSPNDANVFNTIGDLCLKKNAKPEAVDAYKKAADILASDGFTSKAIALYKKVLNIDPKKIEAHLALADLNAEKGLTGNALESYKLVADQYTRNKETVKALGIYQKMADLNATNVAFRLKLADMYVKEGMKKDAIKAFLQAADVHVSKDAFNDARQIFEKALALDPNNKDVYHKAGTVYFKEGKFAEACKALKPAFESDPSNEELSGLYVDALSKAGRAAEAEDVYKKILSHHPERTYLREKLYRFYLEQKDYDKAFSEISSLANLKIESKDLDAAEELLKAFIAEAPRHVGGKRALSALYKTVGKGNEAADVLVQAAEILIQDGNKGEAKDVLGKALEAAPKHAEAKRLMESIEPAAAAAPQDEPVAAEAPPGAAKSPAAPAAPSGKKRLLLEDPVLAEGLTEADVLIKYGLATKAIEQLEILAEKNPKNMQVRMKLRDLYGDQGNMKKAAVHMLVLADLYNEYGMEKQAGDVLQEVLAIDPNNAEIKARLGIAATEPPAPEEIQFEEPAEKGGGLGELPPLDFPAEPAGVEAVPDRIEQDGFFPGPSPAADFVSEEPAKEAPLSEEISFDHAFDLPDTAEGKPEPFTEEAPEPQQAAVERITEQAAVPEETTGGQADIAEIWAEAEFYYQQGLFEEALKHYQKILQVAPENAQARGRIDEISREQENVQEFSKLAEAVDGLEKFTGTNEPSTEMAASASDEEAVRLLMQEIAQLKQKPPAPAPAAAENRKPVPGGTKGAPRQGRPEGDFFDLSAELNQVGNSVLFDEGKKSEAGSDDFFDLAAELRDELSTVSIPPPSGSEEQSLDDIFEEFKRGVEQQAIKEDADTHYNLGIAYKEMGLLDDAISEFVLTPEDEPKFVQSRHMLGLCYMEKGDYQNAIVEIEHASESGESMGWQLKDQVGVWYDLGLAFQGSGNSDGALAQFQKVYDADPGYRDAADKIKELQQGDVISLEQLKDDIEKEISSKFLEEGERIDGEEKTRKNEKVRN